MADITYAKNAQLHTILTGWKGNPVSKGRFIDPNTRFTGTFSRFLKWQFSRNDKRNEKKQDKWRLIVQTGNDFIVINAAGNQLVQIGSDGNDNIKPLMDSAFSFTAAATSDSSYLYFFGSHHDIRSYNEKNEFRTAASLQTSDVSSIEVITINNDKFILVRDKINSKIFIYDLGLKPVIDYKVMNATAFTVTDLFDRKEIIGLQPDATGNIACYRIK